jgi:hypothetical protein
MKRACVCLSISFVAVTAFAQGTVTFRNTPTTLVSAGTVGQEAVIAGPAGSYYFGLLVAPTGTTDPSQFTFADVYATNGLDVGLIEGRLFGGYNIPVPVWPPGGIMSYLVAGWSATLGHDWNQGWLNGSFGFGGFFGLSPIAIGESGGGCIGQCPAWPMFGGSGLTGFNLAPVGVPEPTIVGLLSLGAVALLVFHRRRPMTPNQITAPDTASPLCLKAERRWRGTGEFCRSTE